MDMKLRSGLTDNQLNRILSFFPRVDSKASVLLAIETGMLGLLLANMPRFANMNRVSMIAVVPVALISISIWHLYREAFPNLEGGEESLIYFREIAKKREAKYVEDFLRLSEEDYVRDLLGQIWRNSEILTQKFDHVRFAFYFLLAAVGPWVAALAIFVSQK